MLPKNFEHTFVGLGLSWKNCKTNSIMPRIKQVKSILIFQKIYEFRKNLFKKQYLNRIFVFLLFRLFRHSIEIAFVFIHLNRSNWKIFDHFQFKRAFFWNFVLKDFLFLLMTCFSLFSHDWGWGKLLLQSNKTHKNFFLSLVKCCGFSGKWHSFVRRDTDFSTRTKGGQFLNLLVQLFKGFRGRELATSFSIVAKKSLESEKVKRIFLLSISTKQINNIPWKLQYGQQKKLKKGAKTTKKVAKKSSM